jgi:hypothetical protein
MFQARNGEGRDAKLALLCEAVIVNEGKDAV